MPVLGATTPEEPYFEAIDRYQNHFLPLLESEEAENKHEILERLSKWSIGKLKLEGYCLTDLSAFRYKTNQFGKVVYSFQLGPGEVLPKNLKFENGSQVMMSRKDPVKEIPNQGSIVDMTDTTVKVAFASEFESEGYWRIDLDQNYFIFERMRKAISALYLDLDTLEKMPRTSDQELVLLGTGLRDVLLRSRDPSKTFSNQHEFSALQAADDISYPKDVLSHGVREYSPTQFDGAFKDDMRIYSWAFRYSLDDPLVVEGDPKLDHLNKSQIKAMATMIGKRISLVQGPPGTGKTKTIVETIKLLRYHFEVPHPILVCTYTNVAVNNLVEGLIKAGLNPLRVGSGAGMRKDLEDFSLDQRLAEHPLQPLYLETIEQIGRLEKEVDRVESQLLETAKKYKENRSKSLEKRLQNTHRALSIKQQQLMAVMGKKYGLRQEMLHDIVKSADVVCTTCIASATNTLNVSDFPVVFIDEASMSTEPATLIPIMKGSRHLALIGDHKQLPPVIVSQEAQSQGLGVSLFERLTEEGIVPSVMLDVQYRMHPSISYFPSWEFYNSSIQDGTKDKEGNVVNGLEPPLSLTHLLQRYGDVSSGEGEGSPTQTRPSVIFLDHIGYESVNGRSRVNHPEAQIVVSLVEDLFLQNPQLRGEDIGIIAPYVAQIKLLIRLLTKDERHQQRFKEVLGIERYSEMKKVEVKTVDGFEGREKEVIIFSTVRNNDSGKIGFLADRRRLNVGLTRAKRGLFVVGSMRTIAGSGVAGALGTTALSIPPKLTKRRSGKGAESWKRYAEWLAQEGLVLKLVGEKLNRTLYGNRRRETIKTKIEGK